MNFYRCIFYRGDAPQGKAYTFKSVTYYKAGDIVEVQGHRKAIIVGSIDENDLDYNVELLQSVTGKWEVKEDG